MDNFDRLVFVDEFDERGHVTATRNDVVYKSVDDPKSVTPSMFGDEEYERSKKDDDDVMNWLDEPTDEDSPNNQSDTE